MFSTNHPQQTVFQFYSIARRAMEEHVRVLHHDGACYGGSINAPPKCYGLGEQLQVVRAALCDGAEPSPARGVCIDPEVLEALGLLARLPSLERRQIHAAFETAYEAAVREERRAFARQVHEKLVGMGFSARRAARIMRAAGPGRAVEAVEWARYALHKIASAVDPAESSCGEEDEWAQFERAMRPFRAARDALDMLCQGSGGRHGFGRDRTAAALRVLGLPAVDRWTLAGVQEALDLSVLLREEEVEAA